jgi:hypothetical protein
MHTGASAVAEGGSEAALAMSRGLGKVHVYDAFDSEGGQVDDAGADSSGASNVAFSIGALLASNDRFANGAAFDKSRKKRIRRGRHCEMN